ncbi:hypothetical protein FF38_06331, partial [Lucilia cuprina]
MPQIQQVSTNEDIGNTSRVHEIKAEDNHNYTSDSSSESDHDENTEVQKQSKLRGDPDYVPPPKKVREGVLGSLLKLYAQDEDDELPSSTSPSNSETPVKDIPSLSYGSSSSPQLDPPSSVEPQSRPVNIFRTPHSTPNNRADLNSLLPSTFPTVDFASLESSPPALHIPHYDTPTKKRKRVEQSLPKILRPQQSSHHHPSHTTRNGLHSASAFKDALETQKSLRKVPIPAKKLKMRSPLEVNIDTKGRISVQQRPITPPNTDLRYQQNSI